MNERDVASLFKSKGFRATPQRIAVYKYLYENRTHPDADEIYRAVLEQNPSFSKTTVYNSLQALADEGMIKSISIDVNRVRYDACVDQHGHFICKACGSIFDFDADAVAVDLGDGFCIDSLDVYCSGLCPECK